MILKDQERERERVKSPCQKGQYLCDISGFHGIKNRLGYFK